MGEVFRVLLRMETAPGQQSQFEQAWYTGASVITDQPANLGQWLCRSSTEPDVYYVISDWRDEAGFREYEQSATHAGHLRRLRPYRTAGSMSTMDVLHAMPGTGGLV